MGYSNNAKIEGNTAQNNGENGIYVGYSNNAKIEGNTAQNNSRNGIYVRDNDNAKAHRNNIFGNTNHGLNNSGNLVDATNNWWGPGGTGADAGKPGEDGNNDVSGNVNYTPWSTTPFQIGGAE